jgi:DNA excision repair protein ERCC-4
MNLTLICDTRELPWESHPWRPYLPADIRVIRQALPVGDFSLAGLEEIALERKAGSDLLSCMTSGRDRFEAEMRRAKNTVKLAVVVEANLTDLLTLAHQRGGGLREASVIGTLSAWTRRYSIPFVFCGSPRLACDFAVRYLTQPFREASETARRIERASKAAVQPEAFAAP